MAQLRMRGPFGGHNGARRRVALPDHAPFRPHRHAVFGLGLLAICPRVCTHLPGHHRLSDLALSGGGWGEHGEVEQRVGINKWYPPKSAECCTPFEVRAFQPFSHRGGKNLY